jgi:rhodanese-related sulfurtransferase
MPTDIDRGEVQRLAREEHAQLVEVLPTSQYADEHLPGALSLPLRELSARSAQVHLRRDDPVVVYCNDAV